MRKLKRINVPNIQEQLSQSNENRAINKKTKAIYIHAYIYCAATGTFNLFLNRETTRNNCRKKDTITNQKTIAFFKER